MTAGTIVDLVFTALMTGALGALLWTRLNRIEAGQDDLKHDMARVREQMATRSDIDKVREEMAVMRSDLTHVALAVGANRPKPVEG